MVLKIIDMVETTHVTNSNVAPNVTGIMGGPNRITDVVRLEARARGPVMAEDQVTIETARDGIRDILTSTSHDLTARTALTSLSRLGIPEDALVKLAHDYNVRIKSQLNPGGRFYGTDPPYITSFWVPTKDYDQPKTIRVPIEL